MKRRSRRHGVGLAFSGLLVLLILGCTGTLAQESPLARQEFVDYWFQGKAEISRFELEQARYGEVHEGDAVLVFVTEDFLPEKQVKSDASDRSRTGAWPILKLNATRKFTTGIYPYSGMTSVFTPIDFPKHPRTLKTTTTMQEWCGHTFTQLNLRGKSYQLQTFSYFEKEGDQRFKLDAVWLEDEIWTRIRLDPGSLPTGRVEMILGGQEQRFSHRPFRVERAEAALVVGDDGRSRYTLSYPEFGRTLSIEFDTAFPHRVQEWVEKKGGLETRARRTHTLLDAYWNHNSKQDRSLRSKLGL